jgi:DNA-damage-inducible protein D
VFVCLYFLNTPQCDVQHINWGTKLPNSDLPIPSDSDIRSQLDGIKRINPSNGVDYWMARDLMPILGYVSWENFNLVVRRASDACAGSGISVTHQFHETTKKVAIGSGATRDTADYFLTRYACYLIAMNGETTKPQIAAAQTYFAVQTRRQEIQDQLSNEDRRIALRDRVKTNNRKLSAVAMDAGVSGKRMPVFHASGYQGLYGGRNKAEILAGKGLAPTEDLLDRSGSTELAANEFRITQTKDALEKRGVVGESAAIDVHRSVGLEVRNAIAKIGGAMPENLAPEPSIKQIESARKKRAKLEAKPNKSLPSAD